MKTFLIIGMGTFGHHLCRELAKQKCEIMIADRHEERMADLLPYVTSAKIADCTNPEALRSFDIPSFDTCFVCIGDNFQMSLEVTSLLKELGAKRVFSKAEEDVQAKFLLRNGADAIVFPEQDMAERIAVRESSERIFDFIPLSEEHAVYEISTNRAWIGKTILELRFRPTYNLSILGTKKDGKVNMMPSTDYVFREDEHLIVLGKLADVNRAINS